jgi:hypothetical protein
LKGIEMIIELTDEEVARVLHGLRMLRKSHVEAQKNFALKGKADEANIEESHADQSREISREDKR